MAVRTTEDGRIAYAGQHDRVLGTAAQLLLEDGNQQAAALLLDVHSLDFVVVQVDEWNETTEARIDVDHYLIERFTDDVRLDILEALREANRGQGRIEELVVRRALPEAYDWRERVEAALAGTPTNNAVLAPVQSPHPQADGMLFRDPAEMALYRSLKRAQESAEPGDELLIVPRWTEHPTAGSGLPTGARIKRSNGPASHSSGESTLPTPPTRRKLTPWYASSWSAWPTDERARCNAGEQRPTSQQGGVGRVDGW